jgi:hypothetical protein
MVGDILNLVGFDQVAAEIPALANREGFQACLEMLGIVQVKTTHPIGLIGGLRDSNMVKIVLIAVIGVETHNGVGPVFAEQVNNALAEFADGDVAEGVGFKAQEDQFGDAQMLCPGLGFLVVEP